MQKIRKYSILGIICIILLLPIFFGIYIEYLSIRESTLNVIFIFILGLIILLFINIMTVVYCYDTHSLEVFKEHDVINALITKENKPKLLLFLLLIMIIEELIFRYYLIGFLLTQLELDVITAILVSSIIFSLYHIHMWFKFKNLRILIIYLSHSFLLGLFNGYILLTLGIIPCILVHYSLVLISLLCIYRRYFRKT